MSSLLTREEYQAIAGSLTLPTGAFIDGRSCAVASGDTFDTINPASGAVLARIASCGDAEVDLAVAKAREAFEDGRWSRTHPSERKKTLIALCKLIRRNQHELAVLESLESGKPILEIETVDLPEALHCLEWHAETADKIYDQVAPAGDDAVFLAHHHLRGNRPRGVLPILEPAFDHLAHGYRNDALLDLAGRALDICLLYTSPSPRDA